MSELHQVRHLHHQHERQMHQRLQYGQRLILLILAGLALYRLADLDDMEVEAFLLRYWVCPQRLPRGRSRSGTFAQVIHLRGHIEARYCSPFSDRQMCSGLILV